MGKVAIVGVEGSGKTVLMGALCECYKYSSDDRPYLMAENQAAFMFMERIPHLLKVERVWPEATSMSDMRLMRWSVRYKNEVLDEIELLDYPGELYRIAFGERKAAEARANRAEVDEFLGHLTEAEAVIVLLNLADIKCLGTSARNIETVWITRGILEFTKKLPNVRKTFLAFTQADRYLNELGDEQNSGAAFLSQVPMIKQLFPDIVPVVVAAVDGVDENGNPMRGASFDGVFPIMMAIRWEEDCMIRLALSQCAQSFQNVKACYGSSVLKMAEAVTVLEGHVEVLKSVVQVLLPVYLRHIEVAEYDLEAGRLRLIEMKKEAIAEKLNREEAERRAREDAARAKAEREEAERCVREGGERREAGYSTGNDRGTGEPIAPVGRRMKKLFSSPFIGDCDQLRVQLALADIDSVLTNEYGNSIGLVLFGGVCTFTWPEVVVFEEDFARANEITQTFLTARKAQASAAEARPSDGLADWRCAKCGESVDGSFDVCWNCDACRTVDER
ncbi:MAG: hypothetical protein PHP44_15215 [Kiritimatiellae bacterium]|nr:hypothetical protein [Kiritimatiellia bacterium]